MRARAGEKLLGGCWCCCYFVVLTALAVQQAQLVRAQDADLSIEAAIRAAVDAAVLNSLPEPEPEPEPELPEPEPEPDPERVDRPRAPREAFASMISTFSTVFGCVLLAQLSRSYNAFRKNRKRSKGDNPTLEWRWSRKPYKWRYVPTDMDARAELEAWEDTKFCAGRCCCSRSCCAGGGIFLVFAIVLCKITYDHPRDWPPWATAAPNTTEPWPSVCRAEDGTKLPEFSTEAACVGAWTCSVPGLSNDCTRGACLLLDVAQSECSNSGGLGRRQLAEQEGDEVAVCADPFDGDCGTVGMVLCGDYCVPSSSASFAASCFGNRCADPSDSSCGVIGMVECADRCVPLGSLGQSCVEKFAAAGNVEPAGCPLGCEYSDGWESETIPAANRTIVSFAFAGEISGLSDSLEEFVTGFKSVVSAVLGGIRSDRIVVEKVRPGSIIVDFWLRPANLRGEPTTASLLQQIETQAADGTLATAIAAQSHHLLMLPSALLVEVETTPNGWDPSSRTADEMLEFVTGLGCLDHSIVFPSYCSSISSVERSWVTGTQDSNNYDWEEPLNDTQVQAIVSARVTQAEEDGVFIHTHQNLDEDEPGYNSTEPSVRIAFNFRHIGVFLDLRYPCGVEWREYFGGSLFGTEDLFGGMEALITCDGMSLSTHLGGYFAPGIAWMILGSPLICKLPRKLPDPTNPDSMLALLKRPSRALSGFMLLVSIGTIVSMFHQFVAKGRFEDPVTVDIWLVMFGFFCGGVVPMLPALCCSTCYRLNETRKNRIHPQLKASAVRFQQEAEHLRDRMLLESHEADEAEAKAAEELKQAEEASKLAEQEKLDVSLAQERLNEANKSGDPEEIKKALAALQKEEEEAQAAVEAADKEATEAKLAAENAERERAEATLAENQAAEASRLAAEASLTREEILQRDDMLKAQRLAEAEIEDVGPGVSEELRAVFNLMGGRKLGYLTSAQVKRGLRKYLHLKLSRHELKNLIGKQLEDDRLSYPEFVGLVNAGAEAARRAGENDDDHMSDTTYSQSNISAASLSLGLRKKMREAQESSGDHSPITVKVIDQTGSVNIDSTEHKSSPTNRVEHHGDRQKGVEVSQAEAVDSTAAAEQMSQNYEVAAQLGQLAQQLAVLQEQVVQKQLELMPEPPPRSLPPLKLGPAPPRKRTAMDDLKDLFAEVDSDGSGSIGAEELRAMVQTKVGSFVDKTIIDGLISQADKDGDGVVDWSEFVSMAEAQGWETVVPEEEQPELPVARLSCSTDRHWVFHIRSKSRRAILGRMPAELSAEETEIAQAREQRDPEDQVNLEDLEGKGGTTARCILPCNGLSKELTRKISRRHCEIKLEEENGHWRWTVCSLDGHQFLLNGIRITSHHGRCPLQSYDRIGIGPIVVVFHPEGGDTAAQLAAQAAASTTAALTNGIEIDPEDHAHQNNESLQSL